MKASRQQIAVGIELVELAPAEFADGGFDFGAVAHDHPNQLIGMHHLLRGFRQVLHREGTDLAGISLEIILGQSKRHNLAEGTTDGANGFPSCGQTERLVLLGGD